MPDFVTLRRTTAKERLAKVQEQARHAFANHLIRDRDDRSWLCFCPHKDGGWNSVYWFEAVVLRGGSLVVGGDIDIMHFAHYGKFENPEQVLRWIGGTDDLGYYVAQKAAIGMNLPRDADGVVEVIDDGVWMDEAIDHIETYYLDGKLDTSKEIDLDELCLPEWLSDLIREASQHDIREVLAQNEHLGYEAYEAGAMNWGRVPSSRLVYAHEALRRLVHLLDTEAVATVPERLASGARVR